MPASTVRAGSAMRSASAWRTPFWKLITTVPGRSTGSSAAAAAGVAVHLTLTSTTSASASERGSVSKAMRPGATCASRPR